MDTTKQNLIELIKCKEGGYVANHLIFPVSAEGNSEEEAISNVKETLEFYQECIDENNQ